MKTFWLNVAGKYKLRSSRRTQFKNKAFAMQSNKTNMYLTTATDSQALRKQPTSRYYYNTLNVIEDFI
jgi:hypothetical protein